MNRKRKMWMLALSAALLAAGAIGTGALTTISAADTEAKETTQTTVLSSSAQSNSKQPLSVDRAKELALSFVDGQVLKVDLVGENGLTYYDVEIVKGNWKYDVAIDVYNGKTLKVAVENLTVDQAPKNPPITTIDNKAVVESNTVMSAEQAADIAAHYVGGTVDSVERDRDDGKLIYEVELNSPRGEAEIEVDAYTGNILSVDIDLDDDDE